MGFARASMAAHQVAAVLQYGQTVTIARLSATSASIGEISLAPVAVSSGVAELQEPILRDRGNLTVDVGGLMQNVYRLAVMGQLTATAGQRLYVGASVTTTAVHYFIARVTPENVCHLVEKGPRESEQ